eukprot:gene11595-4838_t
MSLVQSDEKINKSNGIDRETPDSKSSLLIISIDSSIDSMKTEDKEEKSINGDDERSEQSSENDKKRPRDEPDGFCRSEFLGNYLSKKTSWSTDYDENKTSVPLKELHDLYDEVSSFKVDSTKRIRILEKLVETIDKNDDLNEQLKVVEKNLDFENENKEEIEEKEKKYNNNICGVVNSRGKPCQRTGFCPFHHKTSRKRQKVQISDEEDEDDDEEEKKEILSSTRKYDRLASMKVSILLIAAAAIEKESLEKEKNQSSTTTSTSSTASVNQSFLTQQMTNTINSSNTTIVQNQNENTPSSNMFQ